MRGRFGIVAASLLAAITLPAAAQAHDYRYDHGDRYQYSHGRGDYYRSSYGYNRHDRARWERHRAREERRAHREWRRAHHYHQGYGW